MAALGDMGSLLPLLHLGQWRFIQPAESHHLFGAGFLFIGSLMTVESVAGGVWHRSRLRTLLFPAVLIFLGWGMVVVTAVEPRARLVHLSMGLPMIAGGWAEARSRLEDFPRKYADVLIATGLVLAALDTVLFHLSGDTGTVVTHTGLAVLAVIVAGLRLHWSKKPDSLARSLLVSGTVAVIGFDLWLDAFLQ